MKVKYHYRPKVGINKLACGHKIYTDGDEIPLSKEETWEYFEYFSVVKENKDDFNR